MGKNTCYIPIGFAPHLRALFWAFCSSPTLLRILYRGNISLHKSESTKQMEQTLGAKVKFFFNSENFKKWF